MKLALTGGGSAGHCIPHLALLPEFKRNFDTIFYIGSENGIERGIIENAKLPYYSVTSVKLIRSLSPKNLLIPFKLLKGIKEAKRLLKDKKPDLVFSKGGFVSLPVVIAAKKLKIPVICHESDITAGLTNKISARYCQKVLTSFPMTAQKLKNGVFTGSPIRRELYGADRATALKYFSLSGKKPVLLVFGGSLGAKTINQCLRDSLPKLLSEYDILHICGKGNLISGPPDGYVQREFEKRMDLAYAACSFAVSRAGSNAVFELLALQIPALLIPLPKAASRGDQILNAEYFKSMGTVRVLNQESLNEDTLLNEIKSLKRDKDYILGNIKRLKNLDGTERVLQEILSAVDIK